MELTERERFVVLAALVNLKGGEDEFNISFWVDEDEYEEGNKEGIDFAGGPGPRPVLRGPEVKKLIKRFQTP